VRRTGLAAWNAGSAGNYYSDYNGTDPDGDGIGEDPHPITGGTSIDRYLFMQTWAGGASQKGDLGPRQPDHLCRRRDRACNRSGGGSTSRNPAMFAAADVNSDDRVTSSGALMILKAAANAIEL